AFMENRHGLAVAGTVSEANGRAERRAAETMLKRQARCGHRITVGADKAYDTRDHVAALRAMGVTPHVTQNNGPTKTGRRRRSAVGGRTTRHCGYRTRQTLSRVARVHLRLGQATRHMRKARHRGLYRIGATFMLNLIAYNLIRL